MQPNIPIPTDNLYKFQALFGLVLVISCLLGTVLLVKSANEQIFTAAKEIMTIDDVKSPAAKEYADAMRAKARIAGSDRDGLNWFLIVGASIGTLMSLTGFVKWAKIQPLHDELLELQVAKARRDVHGFTTYRELPERPKPKKPAKNGKP